MIKKRRKNGGRLLRLGLLLLLATLVGVGTMPLPQAHAQNALPKDECGQIVRYGDPENPNAVKFYAPYCQVDNMINKLQQASIHRLACSAIGSLIMVLLEPLSAGVITLIAPADAVVLTQCNVDMIAMQRQVVNFQKLENACKQNASNTGLVYKVQLSKDKDTEVSAMSVDFNECGAEQDGLRVNASGEDSIALLQFKETLSDDGSGVILSVGTDAGTDTSSNVALNPTNDSQDVNTVPTPSAANDAG